MSARARRCLLVILVLLSGGLAAPEGFGPGAQAGSVWISETYDDFNGTGMELDNCSLEASGGSVAIRLNRTGDWSLLKPLKRPTADYDFSMAPVGNQDRLVLYGGTVVWGGGGRYCNETWVYDFRNNTWTRMSPTVNPGFRGRFAMAPVLGDDRVLLYGGDHGGISPQTWIYDLGEDQWFLQNPLVNPGWRIGHSMAAISNSTDIVLFGGSGDRFYYCDTWIYNTTDNQWTQVFPADHPSARYRYSMAPVWNTDEVVLFGGDWNGEVYEDTWVFEAGECRWSEKKPAAGPSARELAGMTGFSDSARTLLFGGIPATPGNKLRDTWVYDPGLNRWEQLFPADYPVNPQTSALAAPLTGGNIVLYGSGETWEYNSTLFPNKGTFCSPFRDTGGDCSFLALDWTSEAVQNTSISFQVRTAKSAAVLGGSPFLGPDGTDCTYYKEPQELWWGHHGDRWVQYQAILRTDNQTRTPVLTGVRLEYDRIPEPPVLLEPPSGTWKNTSAPMFRWTFNDSDSASQGAFELQICSGVNFSSPEYSSGVVDSDRTFFTLNDTIGDGTWHWRARTRDIEGEWGPFSAPSVLCIDTIPPDDFVVYSDPSGWTREPCEVRFETTDITSGVAGYDVWIDNVAWGFQESPFTVPHLPDGAHNILVRAYDLAGNHVDSATRILIDNNGPSPFAPKVDMSGWTSQSPLLFFEAQDSASGLDRYEVRVDHGNFSKQSSPYRLPELPDGEHLITVRAFDRVGNYRDGSVSVFIDRTAPVHLLLYVDAEGWTNRCPVLKFGASDTGSGIDHFEVTIRSGVFVNRTSPYALTDLEEGPNLIRVRVYDRAGNSMEGELTVKYDRTAPEAFSPSVEPPGWTSDCPVVRFEANDRTSGIDRYELRIDDGDFYTCASPCGLFLASDGMHDVTVRAFDRAGNFRDGNTTVFIDKSAPSNLSVSLSGGKTSTARTCVTLAIAASDNLSGLDSMCFSNDGVEFSGWEPFNTTKDWTLPGGPGSKTVFVKVRDRAGNDAAVTASIRYAPQSKAAFPDLIDAVSFVIIAFLASSALLTLRRRRKKGRAKP